MLSPLMQLSQSHFTKAGWALSFGGHENQSSPCILLQLVLAYLLQWLVLYRYAGTYKVWTGGGCQSQGTQDLVSISIVTYVPPTWFHLRACCQKVPQVFHPFLFPKVTKCVYPRFPTLCVLPLWLLALTEAHPVGATCAYNQSHCEWHYHTMIMFAPCTQTCSCLFVGIQVAR